MKRFGWLAVATVGLVGVGCAAPAAEADGTSSAEAAATATGNNAVFLNGILTAAGVPTTPAAGVGSGPIRTARLFFSTPVVPNAQRAGAVQSDATPSTFYGSIPQAQIARAENLVRASGAPLRNPPAGLVGSGQWRSAVVRCHTVIVPGLPVTCEITPDLDEKPPLVSDDDFLNNLMEEAGVLEAVPVGVGAGPSRTARLSFSTPVVPNATRQGALTAVNGPGFYGAIKAADVPRAESLIEAAGAPLRTPPGVGSSNLRSAVVRCYHVVVPGNPLHCDVTPDLQ